MAETDTIKVVGGIIIICCWYNWLTVDTELAFFAMFRFLVHFCGSLQMILFALRINLQT